MRTFKFLAIILSCLIIIIFIGCSDNPPSGPINGIGNNIITKYVAVGDNFTAGYQSGSLFMSGQNYSFPSLISKQLKAAGGNMNTFEQPLIAEPGTAGRMYISGFSNKKPVISTRTTGDTLNLNIDLSRPYDNLGIPGIKISGFLDSGIAFVNGNKFISPILRPSNPILSKNVFGQVKALGPDLVTFWLGSNDILRGITEGQVKNLTNPSDFLNRCIASFDSLKVAAPGAKVVVANIPNVLTFPFFTTAKPALAGVLTMYGLGGAPPAPSKFYYQIGSQGTIKIDSINSVAGLMSSPIMITLPGLNYLAYLGASTGKFYQDNNLNPLSYGADTTKPFGFSKENPWPTGLVLDSVEIDKIKNTYIAGYNSAIQSTAASHNYSVLDLYTFFTEVGSQGYRFGGELYTSEYVTGGIFSLDGINLAPRGAGIIANKFIMKMNSDFDMNIPYCNIAMFPGMPVSSY